LPDFALILLDFELFEQFATVKQLPQGRGA